MPAKEHFFKEEKPRSTNMERSQDVLNGNVTARFVASVVAGFKTGLNITNNSNLGPKNTVTGTAVGPFNVNGLTLVVASHNKDIVTVTFSGSGQSATQVAAQINAQAGLLVLAADDGTNKLKLTSLSPSGFIQLFPSSTSLTVLGLVDAAPPIDLAVDLFKLAQGQAFDTNGEQLLIVADSPYVASNPARVDSQVPPVATPQSTGNTSLPFAKGVGNIDIDTFVCLQYLRITDLSILPSVVPGFPFEYPKQDDGYQILLLGSVTDTQTALAAGAVFAGFVRRADGLVSSVYPVGSSTPTFTRPQFGVDIRSHAADPNAHHNKAHQHTTSDGSAILDATGAVLLGETDTPFVTALVSAVGVSGSTKWFGTFAADPSLTGADGTSIAPGIWYNLTTNQFKKWDGATATVLASNIVLRDRVKVAGQDVLDNASYTLASAVVVDPSVITDRFALLPNNVSSGPSGPIASPGGPGLPDAVLLRQLRAGERVQVNGREVTALAGATLGTDGITGGPLFIVNLTANDNGTFWIVVLDNGTLAKVSTAGSFPRDKFVAGQVAVISGKVTGGTSGFVDLRAFGAVGSNQLQDLAATTNKLGFRAVTSEKLAEADGTTGQSTSTGAGVKTNHLQDGCVTEPKLDISLQNQIANNAIPVGTIFQYAGTSLPTGWVECNGVEIARVGTYANLFSAIGVEWGSGDGLTTFNLPDLQGMFLRGRVTRANQTFAPSAVDTVLSQVTIAGHGFQTGDPVKVSSTGSVPGGLNPGSAYPDRGDEGLGGQQEQFIIRLSANIIAFASTKANAMASIRVTITSQGSGTHTVNQWLDPDVGNRAANRPGGATGANVGSTQEAELQRHAHVDTGPTGGAAAAGGGPGVPDFGYITSAQGGNESRPRNAYVLYMIKY